MKFYLFLFLFPLISFACPENYVGRYVGLNDDQFLSKFDSIELKFENTLLSITYNFEGDSQRRFTEVYQADGDDHAGDGRNTGEKYSVHCEQGNLVIRREFKELAQPLIYDFHFVQEELHLIESFEGTEYKRLAARFKKTE